MEEEQHQEITQNTTRIDEILALFDLYWFHNFVLRSLPLPHSTPSLPALSEAHPQLILLLPAPSPIRHRRTRSDESISTFMPTVKPPRLQTIPSGKESLHPIPTNRSHVGDMDNKNTIRKNAPRMTRSMTELELEELKGLTELGFNFSDTEVEKDPRIADIVPGLRRRSESSGLRRRREGEVKVARRPYLSEAWRVRDEEERKRVLRNWTLFTNGDENDVKEQLRRWAHVVASTVR